MEEEKGGTGRIYEFGYLLVGSMPEGDVPVKVSSLKNFFESKGAEFIAEEFPKHVTLAYDMARSVDNKKSWFKDGYFGWMKFEVNPDIVDALMPELKRDHGILRFLLVKTVRESTMAAKRGLGRADYKKTYKRTEVLEPIKPVDEEEIERKLEEITLEE